jgi:hypothetical protein
MFIAKRLTAVAAVLGVVAVGAPVAGASAAGPLGLAGLSQPAFTPIGTNSANTCLNGVTDPGPLGPSGPYGADGPWGPNGPMYGSPNPLGNVAGCGGSLAYMLRGGTVASYVQANLASVGR